MTFKTWCYKHGVSWHAQNLTDGERGSMWQEGRARLDVFRGNGDTGRGYRRVVQINPSWHVKPQTSAGISFQIGGGDRDSDAAVNLDLGLARFWLSIDPIMPRSWLDRLLPGYWFVRGDWGKHYPKPVPGALKVNEEREIRIGWHNGQLWWSLWHPVMSWSSRTPRWRNGNFSPVEFLCGYPAYSTQDLKTESVEIPMPERTYPGTVRLFESTWKRPRWPFARKMVRAEISVEGGIPFPGKGENSWDCGEDATYSLTCPESTVHAAIGAMVESVMRERLKHGGKQWRPEAKAA